jgi:hypothetical protein
MTSLGTLFLPDGRILRISGEKSASFTTAADFRSEHVRYHCLQPFHAWAYEGHDVPVFVTSAQEMNAGKLASTTPTASASFQIKATTKAPPYIIGSLLPEAGEELKGRPGLWMATRLTAGLSPAARRYDQAIVAEGAITVDGKSFPFSGFGLRSHVRGVRIMDGMAGHNWMGGVFPSGLCFGVQTFLRPDGGYYLNEAYVYKDGKMYPNRVIYDQRPYRNPANNKVVVELACDELGVTRITGEDRHVFWWIMSAWGGQPTPGGKASGSGLIGYGLDPKAPMLMSQAVARFECNGEIGGGLDERSGSLLNSDA